MTGNISRRRFSRRDFLKLGGGVLGTAVASALLPRSKALLAPMRVESQVQALKPVQGALAAAADIPPDFHFVATDGWIHLPPEAEVAPYHPDNMAPELLTTYIFGFTNVTGLSTEQVYAQKMKAQLTAPIFSLQVGHEPGWVLKLTNLGLAIRPDLIDAHTLHFHGFRNALPIFDGEPHSSVGVPIVRDLNYFYKPHDPGTYMYHCHFEETEHVHMGMVGGCFIKPDDWRPDNKYAYGLRDLAYGQGPPRDDPVVAHSAYDREYVMTLNEVWSEAHWADSHVQLPEWSDYAPEFWLLNGRVYPDTIAPNGWRAASTDGGELTTKATYEKLQFQPISSLVHCKSQERVLLRLINLGFEEQSLKLTGLKLHVIAKDATLLRGTNGEDLTYMTDTVLIGPGQSVDAIFVAPEVSEMTKLLLYNRKYGRLSNGGHTGYGGQMTEIHVYPGDTTLSSQSEPNEWPSELVPEV
ncbi:MAG: multicopper oxidase domain-containing protein [Anaerolineae bacterium]|nr:multicopper oxidase domain-containing protein [Anaerolineae bacterium]